jgi:hypothetical protein
MSTLQEMGLSPDSGISPEDQKEILKEIEQVATQNRIVTKAEDFVVKALKRGVLFPSVVIGAAIVGLAAGAVLFYVLFQRGESRIVRGNVGNITAEGQLITAVRKDADTKIQEKNLEINSIQSRLVDIDKQRQDLQSNMDAKVNEKAQQLKADMDAAVQAERAKLVKEGLTQKAIDQRILQLQAQQSAQLQRSLDAFKKQAEAERVQAEQNLKTLQQNFTDSLAKANAERTQAVTNAQNQEAALRGQLTAKTQALESATAQAQQALSALALQRQQEDLVTGQLLGLYAVAQQAISQQSYDKALTSLQTLKTYVEKPDNAALPAISRRHDFDEFVIDSLTKFVQGEITKAQTDTASLLDAANELTTLRQHVSQAQTLAQQGKTTDARVEFDAAIQTIPEVAASYAYFIGQDRAAEAARQAALTTALDKAEGQIGARNYAAAAVSYRTAFTYLPISSDRLDKAITNLEATGAAIGSQQAVQAQSRSAAPPLAQADALRAQGKFEEAATGYLSLLGRYPLATQGADAMKGIEASVKGLNDTATAASSQRQQALQSQITSLQQELTARRADVSNLQGQVSTSKDQNTKLLAQIDGLNVQLKTASDLAAKGQISEQQRAALQAKMDAMQKSYGDYTAQEDPVLKAKGDPGLMDTKPYFNAFFQSAPIQDQFPGIADRVKRYDQGFQAAGRSDGLQDAINVVVNFAKQSTPALKRAFIQDQLKTYAKDPDMVDLLQQMDQRLTGR